MMLYNINTCTDINLLNFPLSHSLFAFYVIHTFKKSTMQLANINEYDTS